MLDVRVRLQLGRFQLEASLQAGPGAVTVVVGESGSGKSTLLRLVAGLLMPDQGTITLGGETLVDRERGVFVPPETRPIGYVSQDYALFPHLTATENVAFGLSASGMARGEVRDRTDRALERFGLKAFAAQRPDQLSGGQQQRVALARALVLDPEVLLLDEPLSALDLVTRRTVRGELRAILESLSCTTLFVTHQPAEALAFGEHVVVLESGRVSQSGTRLEFVRQPRSRYVAEFLGVNLFEGRVTVRHSDGMASVIVGDTVLTGPDPGRDGPVRLLVHPHDVVLSLEPPAGSARNMLVGPVTELVPEPPAGDRVRVFLGSNPGIAAQITREASEALGLGPGVRAYASFKATGVRVLPD